MAHQRRLAAARKAHDAEYFAAVDTRRLTSATPTTALNCCKYFSLAQALFADGFQGRFGFSAKYFPDVGNFDDASLSSVLPDMHGIRRLLLSLNEFHRRQRPTDADGCYLCRSEAEPGVDPVWNWLRPIPLQHLLGRDPCRKFRKQSSRHHPLSGETFKELGNGRRAPFREFDQAICTFFSASLVATFDFSYQSGESDGCTIL